VYAMNQYYYNVVGRHTTNVRFYNEINVVSISKTTRCRDRLFCKALDNLGGDVQEEDGGDEGE